jgi:hypothetical protein
MGSLYEGETLGIIEAVAAILCIGSCLYLGYAILKPEKL